MTPPRPPWAPRGGQWCPHPPPYGHLKTVVAGAERTLVLSGGHAPGWRASTLSTMSFIGTDLGGTLGGVVVHVAGVMLDGGGEWRLHACLPLASFGPGALLSWGSSSRTQSSLTPFRCSVDRWLNQGGWWCCGSAASFQDAIVFA